ncbi:MAG TPA: ABC transporter ATP-binding protein [Solirubrobacter sp.]
MDGLTKAYGRKLALAGVSLEIERGITGLLGPNGAGKTTLMRMLATVLRPSGGELRLLGRDPRSSDERTAIRRRLGYLPQDPGFHQHFTAFEFVDYIATLKEWVDRDARHSEVRRVLRAVSLDDVAHRRIRALSGGMRRRVALAQALIGSPELLVLDEPTAGLDPQQRLQFRELVSEAAESSVVLLSTHQTEDVAALCSRVVALRDGAVAFDGTPAALADLARGRVWVSDVRDAGATVAWRSGDGAFRHVGAAPAGARIVEPTLEDGYLTLLGTAALSAVAA